MNFHILVTIFLVVFNGLLMFSPYSNETFLGSNNSFIQLVSGHEQININSVPLTSVQSKLDGSSNAVLNSFGIFDGFSLIIDFIKFLLGFLLSLPYFLFHTNLFPFMFKFLFFIPVFIAYMYSLLGWIRSGGSA